MTTYRITNSLSGVVLGDYQADTPEEALEVMAQDAGYDSYAEAAEATGSLPSPAREELLVELVDLDDLPGHFWHAGFFFWRAETWLGWLASIGPFPAEPAPVEYPSDVLASVQVEKARGPRRFWHSVVHVLDVMQPWWMSRLLRVATLLFLLALPAAAQRFERPAWAAHGQACARGHRDTRAEVLASQCSSVSWSSDGCRVRAAVCTDAYTGAEVATDSAAQALQVDHLLPASVAWKRGTWWHTREEVLQGAAGSRCTTPAGCSAYLAFFNDPRNLIVTRARTNRRKSDLMPGQWCPESPAVRPVIARQFRAVAAAYRTPLTASELAGLRAWDRGVCR